MSSKGPSKHPVVFRAALEEKCFGTCSVKTEALRIPQGQNIDLSGAFCGCRGSAEVLKMLLFAKMWKQTGYKDREFNPKAAETQNRSIWRKTPKLPQWATLPSP